MTYAQRLELLNQERRGGLSSQRALSLARELCTLALDAAEGGDRVTAERALGIARFLDRAVLIWSQS